MRSVGLSLWRSVCAVPVLVQDGWLYLLSGVFGAITAAVAVSSDYRAWGQVAGCSYACAASICFLAERRRRRPAGGGRGSRFVPFARRLALLVAFAGAVLAPLISQLVWRAEGLPGQHAQPEVAVVERAADRAAHHEDPYLRHPTTVGSSPQTDAKQVDEGSFFPYLPGMIPFGFINALNVPAELQDARVALAGSTLVFAALALLSSDASLRRRGRVLQFLVVLPSGALALATGGDDMPVLALMLLGLVVAQKRRPVLAGFVIGIAGTMKFTAWPLLLLLLFAVRDREDRPAPLRYGLAVLLVTVPVVGLGYSFGPAAFLENVVRFPLGLTNIRSPAASPLLGQVLVKVLPHEKSLVTAALLVAGFAIVLAGFARYRPRTPASIARFTSFAMVVATVLAPATRFGYLIYPVNLWVFAYMLEGMATPAVVRSDEADQSSSSISNTVNETVLVGSVPPPRAGVIDAVTGFTTRPTSQ